MSDLVNELDLEDRISFNLECRHFFSGAALYIDGTICASLTPVGLALKLPPNVREELLGDGRGKPLKYFEGGKVKKEYAILSPTVVADVSSLGSLFNTSFSYVLNN